ncbi:ABC transporter permease [Haloechinothrix sp. LS1_15]|uniref:ABC transporter permease n=1 Tax=Haloechinothrix sp. LS1_15 TaxID=2652248 RepID=UPI00294873DD|nr:ABC transporter permease [Haloechinothrix sp. LS1_15]MDV6011294.1 ABC transporter permease [Haloechinothrix sp. LS1_15]
MLRYTIKRLAQLVPALFGLSILLFFWLRLLPGGPENTLLPDDATAEQREALRESLGLNEPIIVQYGLFLQRLAQFDFGNSLQTGRPVMQEFTTRFPATAELALTAMLIAVCVGIPLGYFAARRRGSLLDSGAVAGSLLGICIPVFFLAAMLKVVFAEKLGLLPSAFRMSPGLHYTEVTGFRVLDSVLTGEFDVTVNAISHLVLPGLALSSIPLAVITRMTRASVLEVLSQDYVRTAESKGLRPHVVRGRHVLRNAMLPVITAIGLLVGSLLAGAVLTESVFAFGGIGSFIYESTQQRDYPAILGFLMLIAVIYVVVNLLVDLSYTLFDPRVRVR